MVCGRFGTDRYETEEVFCSNTKLEIKGCSEDMDRSVCMLQSFEEILGRLEDGSQGEKWFDQIQNKATEMCYVISVTPSQTPDGGLGRVTSWSLEEL